MKSKSKENFNYINPMNYGLIPKRMLRFLKSKLSDGMISKSFTRISKKELRYKQSNPPQICKVYPYRVVKIWSKAIDTLK